MKNKNDLASRIVFAFIPFVFLGVLILEMADYVYEQNRSHSRMFDNSVSKIEQMAKGLVCPMWNVNFVQIERMIEAEMMDPNIKVIIVRGRDGQLVLGKVRNKDMLIVDCDDPFCQQYVLDDDPIYLTRSIEMDHENIGSVEISWTNEVYFSKQKIRFFIALSKVLIISAVVLSIIFFSPTILLY